MFDIKKINLQLFADMNTQTTATESLSGENKTYYSDYLIDLVEAELEKKDADDYERLNGEMTNGSRSRTDGRAAEET